MNRDEIIRMARGAGFTGGAFCRWNAYTDDLERFAALVAAAEREACAKVCEAMDAKCDFAAPAVFARAIRARGEA